MSKVKLIAGKYCHYGVGIVPEGETFEAPQRDADILIGLKRARRAASDAVVPVKPTVAVPLTTIAASPVVQPAAVQSDPEPVVVDETVDSKSESDADSVASHESGADETQPRQKRPYRRRDMQAEQ